METLFTLRLLSLAPGKKKMLWKLQFSQLFGQLIVESIEKCFVCFLFSMPTVTALFLPRSDLGCALALWGLQGINIFFSCKLTFFPPACCCYSDPMSRCVKTTGQLWLWVCFVKVPLQQFYTFTLSKLHQGWFTFGLLYKESVGFKRSENSRGSGI